MTADQIGPVERGLLIRLLAGQAPWQAIRAGDAYRQQKWYLARWTERGWYTYALHVEYGWLTALGVQVATIARACQVLRNAARGETAP